MRTDHYKISPTAVLCAKIRANYSDMPYAKEILSEIQPGLKDSDKDMLPNGLVRLAFKMPSQRVKGSIIEGRYYSVTEAIRRLGENVGILEIASGLSTRGLDMSDAATFYIETDLPGMIENKREITTHIRAGREVPQHHFMALDALKKEQLERAYEIMHQYEGVRLAIVNEGLLGYLDDDEQKTIRDNIADFLSRHNPEGAWITPDFSFRTTKNNWFIKYVRNRIMKRAGNRKPNGFESDEEAKEFANQGGLSLAFLDNVGVAKGLSYNRIMNVDPEKVAANSINFRAAFLTLK